MNGRIKPPDWADEPGAVIIAMTIILGLIACCVMYLLGLQI